jgi:DNA modification methylase
MNSNSLVVMPREQRNLHYQGLSKPERLAALLTSNLNFHGEDSSYASHNLHAFAAKFPPQLPRLFIRNLTMPGDVVLDPMMGSGTTIVEALLEGRQAIGFDLDPLAFLISKVKTTPVNKQALIKAGKAVLSDAATLLMNKKQVVYSLIERFDDETRKFIDYWFLPETQHELMALVMAIERVANPTIRDFLELTLSSVIVTKSGGVSLARDLAHGRPHRVETKTPRNALEQFSIRLRKNIESMASFQAQAALPTLLQVDARNMPLPNNVVNLVVTSPPYANAIDYMRAHKFSLVWLGKSIRELSKLRSRYIGSERVGNASAIPLPDLAESTLEQLAQCDLKKASILRNYFIDMRVVLKEIYRVLCKDSAAVIVVGPSTMREINIRTHDCLAQIAATLGFEVIGIARRDLDRNKRMMPARFGEKKGSQIEHRMHEEYVIGLYKG